MSNLVAVYGSLLSGLSNHRVMERAKGELLGTGESIQNINMYSLGGYPSISLEHSSHGNTIRVEVYKVDDEGMKPLNALEGYRGEDGPNFYNRTPVKIKLDDGDIVEAFIYHIDETQSHPVVDGDWRKYLQQRGRA